MGFSFSSSSRDGGSSCPSSIRPILTFLHYGMSVMNPAMQSSGVEQMPLVCRNLVHMVKIDSVIRRGEQNSNVQHQSSCNMPSQKSGAIPHCHDVSGI
ncbi:hypothetical protein GBA52_029132 [Prunus armeniaca]|nr:hypothetical protein GBA52_029132 [Prunus armeniaca]